MTGYPTFSISLNEPKTQGLLISGKLWNLLSYYSEEGYLISAKFAAAAHSNCLAITRTIELNGNKLVQIRNF